MRGLDLLGAGEGLASQTILVRVRKIDAARLRQVAAGDATWGIVVPPAIDVVSQTPELALDMLLPVAKKKLEAIGITADLATSKAPPANAPHEMLVVLGVGTALGVGLTFLLRALYRRLQGG